MNYEYLPKKVLQKYMTFPKISIIVPCFNAEETISVTLSSLSVQQEKKIQIIVVDDCSDDHSAEIISGFQRSDERIEYTKNAINVGVADTKNKGLLLAVGQYVSFLDADDWVHPNFYSNLIKDIEKFDVDFVRCDHIRVNRISRRVEIAPQHRKYTSLIPRSSIGPVSKKTMIDYPYAGTGIFRNDVLKRLEIKFQEGLRSAEDRLFFLRLFYEASSYCVSTENGYFYRKEANSTLTTNGQESQLDIFKAIKGMLEYCSESVSEVAIRLKVTEMSLALIHFHAKNRLRLTSSVNEKFAVEAKEIRQIFEEDLFCQVMSTTALERRKTLSKLFYN